mgnify:CR=1 FL=1
MLQKLLVFRTKRMTCHNSKALCYSICKAKHQKHNTARRTNRRKRL